MSTERIYKGRSMAGAFRFGDRLRIEPAELSEIRPGEVVVFRSAGPGFVREVVHRVSRVLGEELETIGDRNRAPDPVPVRRESLVGRVTAFERGGIWCGVPERGPAPVGGGVRRPARRLLPRKVRALSRKLRTQLRESGLAELLWRPSLQRGWFMTTRGPALKYIRGNRTVGASRGRGEVFRDRTPSEFSGGSGSRNAMRTAKGSAELSEADRAILHTLRCEACPSPFFDSFDPWRQALFLKQAMKHHVAPLVYLRLKRALVPAAWLQDVRVQYLRNTERNLRIFHELSKALRALGDAGIPVLLLKGGHLSHVVYGNIGARVFADVDLLFREEDLARAQRTLFCSPQRSFSKRLPLDIHDRIESSMTRRPIDMSGVWERSRAATIGRIQTRVLAPEDLLVHLSLHLAFHHRFQFGAVRTLCDIRELMRHYGECLDWDEVFTRAAEWGSDKPLCLTLSLARELLGVEFPEGVLSSLRKKVLPGDVSEWAVEQIFHVSPVRDALSPYFWKLLGRGTLREKMALFVRLFFARPESISGKYLSPVGSWRNYLCYAVRVGENGGRYFRALWRICTGDERMAAFRERQQRSVAMMEWLSHRE
jgi:hypothetical protein